MKLAVSNLAWPKEHDQDVADLLVRLGVKGVEIAPTKIWEDPTQVPKEDLVSYRHFWGGKGISIVALQSLLFGRPDLMLFGSPEQRQQMMSYLKKEILLASTLGCSVLIFGSPRNRRRADLDFHGAFEIAVPVFKELGDFSAEHRTYFCIEPNAAAYGCDFITTSDEGWDLVKAVNSPGFGLHLDLGCMNLVGEDVRGQLNRYINVIKHFHVSAKNLEPIEKNSTPNLEAVKAVFGQHLPPIWMSLEMNAPKDPKEAGATIERAVLLAQSQE